MSKHEVGAGNEGKAADTCELATEDMPAQSHQTSVQAREGTPDWVQACSPMHNLSENMQYRSRESNLIMQERAAVFELCGKPQAAWPEKVLTRFAVNHCRPLLAICSLMIGSPFTCRGIAKAFNLFIPCSQS